MSLAILPCLETVFPHWFVNPPEKTSQSQKISGDWATVHLCKRTGSGKLDRFDRKYTLELSSGDLYGIPEKEPSKPYKIALKCAGIFVGTIFYTPGMMAFHSIQAILDITSIFWRVIPELINELRVKPVFASLANASIKITCEIPLKLIADIRRVVQSPLFALGMLFASLIGVIYPQEGRKWLGAVELQWHEGATYRQDFRYQLGDEGYKQATLCDLYRYAQAGNTFYLGYCMQKRGNINEMIKNKPRFTYYKNEEKV